MFGQSPCHLPNRTILHRIIDSPVLYSIQLDELNRHLFQTRAILLSKLNVPSVILPLVVRNDNADSSVSQINLAPECI